MPEMKNIEGRRLRGSGFGVEVVVELVELYIWWLKTRSFWTAEMWPGSLDESIIIDGAALFTKRWNEKPIWPEGLRYILFEFC